MSDGFKKWSSREAELPAIPDHSVSTAIWVFLSIIGLLVAADYAHGAWTKHQNREPARAEREAERVANEQAWAAQAVRERQDRAEARRAEDEATARLDAKLAVGIAEAKLRAAETARLEAEREAAEWRAEAERSQAMAAARRRLASLPLADPNASIIKAVREEMDELRAELNRRERLRQSQEFFDSFDK